MVRHGPGVGRSNVLRSKARDYKLDTDRDDLSPILKVRRSRLQYKTESTQRHCIVPNLMSRKPCRFVNNPGGCRRGDDCSFSHASSNEQPPSSPPPSVASSQRGHKARTPNCPPGVCRFYWSSGRCNREFECRYKHTTAPGAPVSSTRPQSPALGLSASDAIAPFLTESGLAKLNGNGTDAFFASPATLMSPSETHNSLKKYLWDEFRFRKSADVYGFLIPLSNANLSNSTWVSCHSLPRSTVEVNSTLTQVCRGWPGMSSCHQLSQEP